METILKFNRRSLSRWKVLVQSIICSIICEADIVPYEVVNVRVNSAYLMWKDTRCSQYNSQYSKVLFHAHQNKGHAGCF